VSEWGAGYVDEIAYTHGYCDELNPLRLNLALLHAGLALPNVQHACELGFGHGVSVNMHAAGAAAQWHGTDFNPAHAEYAQRLAAHAGSHAQLSAERFAEFCCRADLPQFDYIGMHGLWSWISADNRALITEFIGRTLKPGGVLYISYNTEPGWAAMQPVRELMHRHFQASAPQPGHTTGAPASVAARIAAALDYAQSVFAAQPGYALVHPGLAERVQALPQESLSYLAHEYFNRDWQPMSFAQVSNALSAIDLGYAGSAHYRDHIDPLNLTAPQIALLAGTADTALRETARDFCMNRSFRRDYWVKQPRRLSMLEQQLALRAQRVILALPRAAVQLKVRGALGEASLPPGVYQPILDALDAHRPATLQAIEARVRHHGIGMPTLVPAVMLLISMGVLLNAQEDAQIQEAAPRTRRLNAAICEQARHDDTLQFLASPVSASGIRVPRLPQLFLLARLHGLQDPAQWAEFASVALRASLAANAAAMAAPAAGADALGSKPHSEGVPPTDLAAQAEIFAQTHLPVLQALGIA
jgi:SAM-dependent methyltransferase